MKSPKKTKDPLIIGQPLESYATFADDYILQSREHPSRIPTLRSEFERDRDRVLHSKAFRRLAHKSQVFIYYLGDHHRTRLTHTLEVESISNSISSILGLNVFLSSAIALAHDLGGTPFAKCGEKRLDEILKNNSLQGFRHNHQGVRVVEHLEKQYPDYPGLNLTLAVKEGILKHKAPAKAYLQLHSEHLNRFLEKTNLKCPSTLEAQVVRISDEIAQIYHYVEDGLRYDLIPVRLVLKSRLWEEVIKFMEERYSIDLDKFMKGSVSNHENDIKKLTICRFIIKFLVMNVIEYSKNEILRIGKDKIKAGKINKIIIKFDDSINKIINKFYEEVIETSILKNNKMVLISTRCEHIIDSIFKSFRKTPALLPQDTYALYKKARSTYGNSELRVLSDHISGMTDRYAIKIFKDLTDIDQVVLPFGRV